MVPQSYLCTSLNSTTMKTTRLLLAGLLVGLLYSCQNTSQLDAQAIIDRAIEVHGGERYETSIIRFSFRDRQYERMRNGGTFRFSRTFQDSAQQTISDVLTNSGLTRRIEGQIVPLSQEDQQKYTASVNSVIYFALLPYRLNDAAVIKKYLGEIALKGMPYHKIEVTFRANGGGEDYQDVFVYWIHQEDFTIDYLAYSYAEEEGIGTRFREAYNARVVNGIRFADYINYKGNGALYPGDLDTLFAQGSLEILSKIELEGIEVEILADDSFTSKQ